MKAPPASSLRKRALVSGSTSERADGHDRIFHPEDYMKYSDAGTNNGLAKAIFFSPWHRPEETRPNAWVTIEAMVTIFWACLLYGWVFLAAYRGMLDAGTDQALRGFLLGVVSGIFFYLTTLQTNSTQLPIVTHPSIALSYVFPLKLGVLTWLLYAVFQFGGYATAGAIMSALGWTSGTPACFGVGAPCPLVDVPNVGEEANAYWMLWLSVSFITFFYLYNETLEFHYESEESNQGRASAITGLAIAGFSTAFHQVGLVSFNAGLYFAGAIASGNWDASPGGVTDWTIFILVSIFACAATAGLLWLVHMLLLFGDSLPRILLFWRSRRTTAAKDPAYDSPPADEAVDYDTMQAKAKSFAF